MPYNKPKPDDRSDNVKKLQKMVQNTIYNMEASEDTMAHSSRKDRDAIKAKNARRQDSIDSMRRELHDEAAAKKNGYSNE